MYTCYQCEREFSRLSKKKSAHDFCSVECRVVYQRNQRIEVKCTNCDTKVFKTKYELQRSPNSFCSRSCSASYNNRIKPKRKASKKICATCPTEIARTRKYCSTCFEALRKVDWTSMTLGELQSAKSYGGKDRYNHFRTMAREIYKSGHDGYACAYCGYAKHIQVAHIKAISSFPKSSFVAEVNSLNNLIGLCPNHHWELDNSLLTLNEIKASVHYKPPR